MLCLLRGQDDNLTDGVGVRGAVGAALEDRHLVLLLPALNSIAVFTKHLAVFYCGLAAIVPRVYVVCFHFSYFKVIAAVSANAALLLIYFSFGFIVKLPQAQQNLINSGVSESFIPVLGWNGFDRTLFFNADRNIRCVQICASRDLIPKILGELFRKVHCQTVTLRKRR